MHPRRMRYHRGSSLLVTWLLVLPFFGAMLAATPVTVLGAENGTGTGNAGTPTKYEVKGSKTPAPLSAAEQARLAAALEKSNGPGPTITEGPDAKKLPGKPQAAPTEPKLTETGTAPGKHEASDFVIYESVPIGLPAGAFKSTTNEPSIAMHNNVAFFTSNWSSGYSIDYGNTWTFVDPFSAFPSLNGGFCCDQDVVYDPSRDLFIWEMQYSTDAGHANSIRINVATTAQVMTGTWFSYIVTPTQLGFSADTNYDYPNVGLSDNFFYYTTNIFVGTSGFSSAGEAMRFSLDLFASHGALTYQGFQGSFTMVPTHGAKATMYLVSRGGTTTTARIYPWPEANALPSGPTIINHTSFNTGTHICTTPDTFNPCARDDNRMKTAAVANGVITAFWDVGQGAGGFGTFAYPYIQGIRVLEAGLTLASEPLIYSSGTAFGWPGLGVTGRGGLGASMMFGGGSLYPSSALMVSDDFHGGSYEFLYPRTGTNSPSAVNRWGDYYTARAWNGNGNNWVGIGETLQGPCSGGGTPCANVETRFYWFGRQRDLPAGHQALPGFVKNGVTALSNGYSGTVDHVFGFGSTSTIELMCDWTGNGQQLPVLFDPATGAWIFGTNNTAPTVGLVRYFGGGPGDMPICGDWDGTGIQKIGLYRPNSGGQIVLSYSNTAPAANVVQYLGGPGWIPVAGDWNGTGSQKIGLFQNGQWALTYDNHSVFPPVSAAYYFGAAGQQPIAGDWNRDGRDSIGVFINGFWAFSNDNVNPAFYLGFGSTGGRAVIWR